MYLTGETYILVCLRNSTVCVFATIYGKYPLKSLNPLSLKRFAVVLIHVLHSVGFSLGLFSNHRNMR